MAGNSRIRQGAMRSARAGRVVDDGAGASAWAIDLVQVILQKNARPAPAQRHGQCVGWCFPEFDGVFFSANQHFPALLDKRASYQNHSDRAGPCLCQRQVLRSSSNMAKNPGWPIAATSIGGQPRRSSAQRVMWWPSAATAWSPGGGGRQRLEPLSALLPPVAAGGECLA